MKNNLLKIVALLMALTMVFGLAACKSGGDSKDNPDNQDSGNYAPHTKIDPSTLKGSTIDVLWWQNLTEDDKKIFENFENEYGIKVNVTETTFSNYSSKLSSMIIAKEGLDLAVGSGFPYSIKQVYNPIDDFGLDLTDEFWDQNYIKSSTYNGKVYAVTSTSSYWFNTCEVLYYNLDFFKNNGLKTPRDYWKENNWNWETLEKICEDIAKLKTDIVPLGYEFTSKAHLLSGTNFNHYDGEKFVSDMDDKRIIDAFSLAYKFSAKKYLDFTVSGQTSLPSGKVAMVTLNSWGMRKDSVFKNASCTVDAVPAPSPKDNENIIDASQKWCLPKGADNAKAAGLLLAYMLDSKNYPRTNEEIVINPSMLDTLEYIHSSDKKFVDTSCDIGYVDTAKSTGAITYELPRTAPGQQKTVIEKYRSASNSAIDAANRLCK